MTNRKIPINVRQTVWNTYIGEDIGKIKCPLCQQNDISPFQFHCAYVIARSKGGSCDASNLRPICSVCNHSMYNHDLIEFTKTYYPNAPIHRTLENYQIINELDLLMRVELTKNQFIKLTQVNENINKNQSVN